MSRPIISILHVPYTYFPDASGGTEVYVRALAQRLSVLGWKSAIAAPAQRAGAYERDGLSVFRFATDQQARPELAHGLPDEIAAQGFREILERLKPRVVHLHARSAAVSERLAEAAHEIGAAVVFTYHTPTVSCVRGTMMLFGTEPCDGHIERQRCTVCAAAAHGVPTPLARAAINMPGLFAYACNRLGRPNAPRILRHFFEAPERFSEFMENVDCVVAVCEWVESVLERNGVPSTKIVLSRQGLAQPVSPISRKQSSDIGGALRIAYFGRIDRTKGVDLLGRALKLIPDAHVRVDVYGVKGSEREYTLLAEQARENSRLAIRQAIAAERVAQTMARYDLIAVPSRWLETGPLVVLEAFAAGVPVLGSNLGGIAELVRDGIDGVLVAADDAQQWANAISWLASDRDVLVRMRERIKKPRTMETVAREMAAVYDLLLGTAKRQSAFFSTAGEPATSV